MKMNFFPCREILRSFLFPALCLGSVGRTDVSSVSRPNVLFIISDDLNDFVGPLRGYVPNLTPNMDRLAARGVSFKNAEANGLYCAPSRTSLLTGFYPTTTGYYGGEDNARGHMRNTPAIKDAVTIPQMFMNSGYATFVTGKLYHILSHAEYQYFTGDTGGADGHLLPHDFGPWPWDGVRNPPGKYLPPVPHPGGYPPFNTLSRSGFSRLSNIPDVPADPAHGIPGYRGWTLHQRPWKYVNDGNRARMPDEQSVKWATERLMRGRDKPFFMVVGLVRSHTPWYVPDQYFDLFPLDQIPLPPAILDDPTPGDSREGKLGPHDKGWDTFKTFYNAAGEQGLKEILQAYLAAIRFVDDQIGDLMKALDESPAASNTLIVYTSDQGYHNGEKHRYGTNTCWER
ncbi:MAG: sulfatase-like hydrolase/transferase, partial [Kiritimatiellales bacterium]